MTKTEKCSLCGLEKLNGQECRDGYVHHEEGGKSFSATCPNMRKKWLADSSNTALGNAGIPEPYLKKTFDEFDAGENRGGVEVIKKWSKNPVGWIFLAGDVGTGKTHLACAAMQGAILSGKMGYVASVPDILWEVQPSARNGNELMNRLMEAPILCLDDFGAHRDSPFAVEVLFRLVNRRYMAQLPTIITSNWTLHDMGKRGIDWKRIADRILELCKPDRIIRLKGGSRR